MNTLFTVVTIAAVVVILAAVVWTLFIAPFRAPRHSRQQ